MWQYANLEMRRIGYLQAVAQSDAPPNRIAELREEIGMSQVELARRANVAPSTLNKVELGKRRLDQTWMRRLAPHLGCAPADLLPDADNPDRLRPEARDLALLFETATAIQRKQIFVLVQTILSPEQIELLRNVA
jgi:transcriptional regulator with XRE-family HTH domain